MFLHDLKELLTLYLDLHYFCGAKRVPYYIHATGRVSFVLFLGKLPVAGEPAKLIASNVTYLFLSPCAK